jgi:hypothetical protein
MTFSIMTLSVTMKNATFSVIALDAVVLGVTNEPIMLSVIRPSVQAKCRYAECCLKKLHTDCRKMTFLSCHRCLILNNTDATTTTFIDRLGF